MKNTFKILFISLIAIYFSGCGITNQVTAEYYLQEEKYEDGSTHFQKKVNKNSNDHLSQYYYARFLLAKNKNTEAIVHLKEAVRLNSKNADYYSWLGVAYSKIKDHRNERAQYLKALNIDKNHLQSLAYLAHNYYGSKQYKRALVYYQKVLKLSPENKAALFNRAMVLRKLKRTAEEKTAWIIYLEHYLSGVLSQNAVNYLNAMGYFEYQNHVIGIYTVILKKIKFEPFSSKIKLESKSSLDLLSEILEKNKKIEIHIVSYLVSNNTLAKQRAQSIKKYILKESKNIDSKRIKLSWFKNSKKIKVGKKRYEHYEFIDFITATKKR